MTSEQAPPVLSFQDARALCRAQMTTGLVPYLIGGPGLGKSALARLIAEDARKKLVTVIGSNLDPTDVGGLPVVDVVDGERVLRRVPMQAIRDCLTPGTLLFLDELTGVPLSVRQPMLRLVLERVAGDLTLSEDLWIMAAGNLPEQCPAGQEIDAALGNRLQQIEFRPTTQEICDYMRMIGEPGSALREAGVRWAAIAEEDGRLVQFDPPEESIVEGRPFASPRAIEAGLRASVECDGLSAKLQRAAYQSAWGEAVGARYWGILQYCDYLPTAKEICKDPTTAKLPERPEHQIAAFGVISAASLKDGWAAWIYCERLPDEVGARVARQLLSDNVTRQSKLAKKSKWKTRGNKAMKSMLLKIRAFTKGTL